MINLFLIDKIVTKYKAACLQISLFNPSVFYTIFKFDVQLLNDEFIFCSRINIFGDLFSFHIEWTRMRDHAGFELTMTIFGFMIHFNIYDCRHWNYDKNCWQKLNEQLY